MHIYIGKSEVYQSILELAGTDNILAVTNPSFELFLYDVTVSCVNASISW